MALKFRHAILIVDDEESVIKAMLRLFRHEPYDIFAATNGREGLRRIGEAERSFSVIISDQRMPEMTGTQFLAEARKFLPDTMRVLLTGYSDMDVIIDAINKGGIHRYLTKPWNDGDIVLQVRQILEQYELILENRRLLELTKKQNEEVISLNDSLEEKVKEKTEEIIKVRDLLIQSEKLAAVGQLSAGIAHEILNPINIMSMRLQLVEMTETLSDKVKAALQVCKDQITKVTRITKDLSQFARVSGKQVVTGDLNRLIDNIVTLAAPRLKVENVKTAFQYQPDLPLIPMDKDRIGQVILNLINNALDAMDGKEEKTLHISTACEDDNVVRLVLSDTGAGIEPEILNKIFDPFFTTKEPGKGTGLGLSVSYGIVRDHAGKIWAENNEWGGVSVFIELPVKHDTEKNER